MMLNQIKKIGIWGFGQTGKSVLSFVSPLCPDIIILEPRPLTPEQKSYAQKYNALCLSEEFLPQFLQACDIIIPSPGVDLSRFTEFQHKFVSELSLFAQLVTTKTIAFTGSVGKTSVVTILTELLNRCGKKSIAAGNIGTPMLDVLATQHEYEWIVLELSSFQLELPTTFAPTLCAITNLFENHLDRHKTLFDYAQAKSHIFTQQTGEQLAIIPQEFLEYFIHFTKNQKILWLAQDAFSQYITPALSDITFKDNWNVIFAILETLGITPEQVLPLCADLQKPAHRLEKVGTFQGITFYNDSKATIGQATLASLETFKDASVILFLGGVSKGVDRASFIQKLPTTIKHVICFGKEADYLAHLCQSRNLPATSHHTFEDAWDACLNFAQPSDIVLFSPAGASFDLFKDYQERGDMFKKYVFNFAQIST